MLVYKDADDEDEPMKDEEGSDVEDDEGSEDEEIKEIDLKKRARRDDFEDDEDEG